jgi:hypothetical protein
VLLGKGNGTFEHAQTYLVKDGVNTLAVSDLNGDGKPDLAVADHFNLVTVLLQA